MTEPNNNPFASPPIEDEDPSNAPLMDGDRMGRWLALPMLSGALNGAGIVGIGGATVVASVHQWNGNLVALLWYSDGRTILGMQLLVMVIYGGVLGGGCGLIHGSVAYLWNRYSQNRSLIFIAGYLLPLAILTLPALAAAANMSDIPLSWTAYLGIFLFACGLLFGWRMNRNIDKYLLSRFERETSEAA